MPLVILRLEVGQDGDIWIPTDLLFNYFLLIFLSESVIEYCKILVFLSYVVFHNLYTKFFVKMNWTMCLNTYIHALMTELLFIFLQICSFIHQIFFACLLYVRHYTESKGYIGEQIVKNSYTNKIINEDTGNKSCK